MLAEGWPVNCRVTEVNCPYEHKLLYRGRSRIICRHYVKHSRRCRITLRAKSAATDHHSLYSVLGVSRDATLAEVKTAYRRLAIKWHPDHASGAEARETYQAVKDAYDVLGNHTRRHHYNKHGLDGLNSHFNRYEATHDSATQQHVGQGQNVDAMLGLTFMEAALGTERVFQVSVRLQCPDCSGSGLSATSQPLDCTACHGTGQTMRYQSSSLGRTKSYGTCPACGGKGVSSRFWCKRCGGDGRAVTPRHVRVKIPAGVDHGSILRLNAQGDVGTFGSQRGDIILRFVIHPEDSFTRQGCDVYSTVPIAYTDAILGANLDVQTLRGTTAIQVAPGTQHNTTLRLSEQGVQAWGSTSAMFGSHYVTLHVLIPSECTAEEQHLLKRIQWTARTNPVDSKNVQQHQASPRQSIT